MSYDSTYIDGLFKLVEAKAKAYRDAQPTDTPFGSHTVTPEQIAAFMEQKELEQPGYIRALPYVQDGMRWVAQYEKARGLR